MRSVRGQNFPELTHSDAGAIASDAYHATLRKVLPDGTVTTVKDDWPSRRQWRAIAFHISERSDQ